MKDNQTNIRLPEHIKLRLKEQAKKKGHEYKRIYKVFNNKRFREIKENSHRPK